jgi:hypothetical protein
VVIPIDTSFIQDLLIANEIFAGFALRNVTDPSGVFTFYTIPLTTFQVSAAGSVVRSTRGSSNSIRF